MAPFLITVFGAGGKTGQECVKAALARGDSVRAVVREQSLAKYEQAFAALSPASAASSSSSSSSSSKLEVVAGDVEASPDDLEKLLSGASAAIFAASASKTGDVWKVDRDGLANLATAAAKAAAGSVRVVAVSSEGHRHPYPPPEGGPIRFERLNDSSGFGAMPAYCQSKLCNVLFVRCAPSPHALMC